MIRALREMGAVRSDRVAEVFRAVPRHWFTPGAPLDKAYAPRDAVHMKHDEQGRPISTVSSPQLQGSMLEQADIQPGMSALEIGSGGVNAAMMSWLTGPEGRVVTVDIDPDVTARARQLLDAAGYQRVQVVLADADNGVPEHASYDRIIVTVGAWDIPPAWVEQLAPGGRLVVPLRMRGLTRSLELVREGNHLVSRSSLMCGFVAMQGAGANGGQMLPIRDGKAELQFDDGWPGPERPALEGALDTSRVDAWSAVMVGGMESLDLLQLRLATTFSGFGRLAADEDQRPVLVEQGCIFFDSAVALPDSFAYLVARRSAGGSELGVHAFGPHAQDLAEAMVEQIQVWDQRYRGGPDPDFAIWPRDTPDDELPDGLVIDKRRCRISISWPPTTNRPHPHNIPK
ncbi:methyltransferase, FxLD system [Labedaea rhizosphaerae]|uniref:Protein-L-isoaspartate O-methyltransferase n=1 Tax=Labedaea rhizosphaerae TaxID=598644 RepID=A0A4R6SI67_LABRH|nr:methyltransferase, FxLD system [Labedaea rhizosphaerae]TDQ00648.1 protein-L-isoaspartate(D-aspartate) O-methyltransferase [Labedaea rhizosphaerae]